MTPKGKDGGFAATDNVKVYKFDYATKEVTGEFTFKKGEYVKYKKGDIVEMNPRRYVVSDNLDQSHRRSMVRAFGSTVKGVSEFDAFESNGFIKQLEAKLAEVSKVEEQLKNVDTVVSGNTAEIDSKINEINKNAEALAQTTASLDKELNALKEQIKELEKGRPALEKEKALQI